MKVQAIVKKNLFPAIAAGSGSKVAQCVNKAVSDVEAKAKALVPVDTGNLMGSIAGRMTGMYSGEVRTGVEYAVYVEFGTRAHVITPKSRKALYWKGAAHPVKVVHHPGTAPHPYMVPAAEATRGPFLSCLAKAYESAA